MTPAASSLLARPLLLAIDLAGDSMTPSVGVLVKTVVASLVFALLGILVFALAFWIITKVVPFSIRKEIEDDQNTSLGIVIGAVIIGLALIISSAIHG
jgi:putative membrane protein